MMNEERVIRVEVTEANRPSENRLRAYHLHVIEGESRTDFQEYMEEHETEKINIEGKASHGDGRWTLAVRIGPRSQDPE